MEILLSPPSRKSSAAFKPLLFVLVVGVALFGIAWEARGVTEVRIAVLIGLILGALVFFGGYAREVAYVPETRRIKVSWRIPILGARQKEFSLDRFESVVSYYPITEDTGSTVILLERSARRGLALHSFPPKYVSGSFWPVEADGAQELRARVSSLLEVRDAGYMGRRRPIKESQ